MKCNKLRMGNKEGSNLCAPHKDLLYVHLQPCEVPQMVMPKRLPPIIKVTPYCYVVLIPLSSDSNLASLKLHPPANTNVTNNEIKTLCTSPYPSRPTCLSTVLLGTSSLLIFIMITLVQLSSKTGHQLNNVYIGATLEAD